MKFTSTIAAGAALAAGVSAGQTNYLGFNSGATLPDESAKFEADFLAEFSTAQKLSGAPGTFNAVRLYTNVQAYSKNTPIEAFSAAIKTKTKILLGVWASGTTDINNELTALDTAVQQYGSDLTDLIIGISIGSEDLYRDSSIGQMNNAGIGNGPDAIVSFINAYRKKVANTALSSVPVGHVDTWDAWYNSSNKDVLAAVDWVGVDEYPFYESGEKNTIENAGELFNKAYQKTLAVANGKPVWVTETGWPLTGPTTGQAVPSVENAKSYWDQVGCGMLFNKVPTFWYNLRDSNPANQVKFGVNQKLDGVPSFNLTCPAVSKSTASSTTVPATTGKGSTPTTLVTVPSQTSGSGSQNTGSAKGADSSSDSSASTTTSSPASATSHSAGVIDKVASVALAGVAPIAGIIATLL